MVRSLSGFPAEELMKISGHKSPAAFMRYIKVDNQQAANRLKALRNSLHIIIHINSLHLHHLLIFRYDNKATKL